MQQITSIFLIIFAPVGVIVVNQIMEIFGQYTEKLLIIKCEFY